MVRRNIVLIRFCAQLLHGVGHKSQQQVFILTNTYIWYCSDYLSHGCGHWYVLFRLLPNVKLLTCLLYPLYLYPIRTKEPLDLKSFPYIFMWRDIDAIQWQAKDHIRVHLSLVSYLVHYNTDMIVFLCDMSMTCTCVLWMLSFWKAGQNGSVKTKVHSQYTQNVVVPEFSSIIPFVGLYTYEALGVFCSNCFEKLK